ncbi:MAG: ribosome small subunit-dependent GTPase A [Bacteroidetes bacterium]|nr:ribosome small subunit-dependent GTPase A [Bacteroidota bacterium]MBU2585866.1 ribosome small subunit-dependent GTPase A [Bacteroidota bacterium]
MNGIVSRIESKDYYVFTEDKEIRCSLRGKFRLEAEWKKDKLLYTDLVVVGDHVKFSLNDDGTGVIEELPERKNYLSRKAPLLKGISEKGKRVEQIIAANVDYTVCVTSTKNPKFNNRVLDRMIVTAESCKTKPVIVINKIDLEKKKKKHLWHELYSTWGYNVFSCSAETRKGIEELKDFLKDKVSVFIGHSGVGKSSILNSFSDKIDQNVEEISEAWDKGVHTTVTSVLFKINDSTFVIDTPGIREIEPYGITKKDVTHYFKELANYSRNCRFSNCTHTHEPECKVKEAVEEGNIFEERYESYLRLIESLDEEEF